MQFPIWYLLFIYAIFVILATIFTFFNVFHIGKFGLQNTKTTIVMAAYIGGYIGSLIITLAILSSFDWTAVVDLDNLFPGSSTSTLL